MNFDMGITIIIIINTTTGILDEPRKRKPRQTKYY